MTRYRVNIRNDQIAKVYHVNAAGPMDAIDRARQWVAYSLDFDCVEEPKPKLRSWLRKFFRKNRDDA